jgi:hypothetical protein
MVEAENPVVFSTSLAVRDFHVSWSDKKTSGGVCGTPEIQRAFGQDFPRW